MEGIELIRSNTQDLKLCLQEHELYNNLSNLEDVRTFMEHHVFAVWDFMSLLKSLQQNLTCINVPWTPSNNPKLARFINEIVLEEETDVNENGEFSSHFTMYVEAMKEIGASTTNIEVFLDQLSKGNSIENCIDSIQNDSIREFVQLTFATINTSSPHSVASAFNFGREDVLPNIFLKIISKQDPSNCKFKKFRYYLQRHIELDSNDHGPLADELIKELCGDDSKKWSEVLLTARESLIKRIHLWDSINNQIVNSKRLVRIIV